MVYLKDDGTLCSHYNKAFQYAVGEKVNGGDRGIWFHTGYGVIGGTYYNYLNAYIIELEGGEQSADCWGSGTVLHGDVKVVTGYTKMEFIKKYGYQPKEGGNDD